MTTQTPAPAEHKAANKTLFAAGVLLAMFGVSLSIALYTGHLLLQGGPTSPLFSQLPADCQAVIVLSQPHKLRAALQSVALPAVATQLLAHNFPQLLDAAQKLDLSGDKPMAICALQDGEVLVVKDDAAHAGTPGLAVNLDQSADFQEALERAGGGQLQLYLTAAALQKQFDRNSAVGKVLFGMQDVRWLAGALRVDDKAARVHLHLGAGQRGAVWLKQHFDPPQDWNPLRQIDSEAVAVALVNFEPRALPAANDVPGVADLDALLRSQVGISFADLAAVSTGHLLWQQLPAGQQWLTVPLLSETPLPPSIRATHWPQQQIKSTLLLAKDHQSMETALDLIGRASFHITTGASNGRESLVNKPIDLDRQRLFTQTQGIWLAKDATATGLTGPAQLEWLWLDTGLIAEWTVPVAK